MLSSTRAIDRADIAISSRKAVNKASVSACGDSSVAVACPARTMTLPSLDESGGKL
jgi:hypothetical protein